MKSLDKEFFLDVICKWKSFWMNQTQNSEDDRQNYFNRAYGVDANMKHHLAEMCSKAAIAAVSEASGEFDKNSAFDRGRLYFDSEYTSHDLVYEIFADGARWQFEKCRAEIGLMKLELAEAKAEIERLKKFEKWHDEMPERIELGGDLFKGMTR